MEDELEQLEGIVVCLFSVEISEKYFFKPTLNRNVFFAL